MDLSQSSRAISPSPTEVILRVYTYLKTLEPSLSKYEQFEKELSSSELLQDVLLRPPLIRKMTLDSNLSSSLLKQDKWIIDMSEAYSASVCTLDPVDIECLYQQFQSHPTLSARLKGGSEKPILETPAQKGGVLSYFWSTSKVDSLNLNDKLEMIFRVFQRLVALKCQSSSTTSGVLTAQHYVLLFPRLISLHVSEMDPKLVLDLLELTGPTLYEWGYHGSSLDQLRSLMNDSLTVLPNALVVDFSACSLETLSDSMVHSLTRCISLDVSHNRFPRIPSALHHIKTLDMLYLSHNRISSLTHLIPLHHPSSPAALSPTASLPNTVLDLKHLKIICLEGNQLENLEGIEQLESLHSLNVRQNRVWDVYEVARLASLKHIQYLMVNGNPFTKLDNYRVNIFSYFKERAQLIVLDGSFMSSGEKKRVLSHLTVSAPKPITSRDPSLGGHSLPNSYQGSQVMVKGKRKKAGKKTKRIVLAETQQAQSFGQSSQFFDAVRRPSQITLSSSTDGDSVAASLVDDGVGSFSPNMSPGTSGFASAVGSPLKPSPFMALTQETSDSSRLTIEKTIESLSSQASSISQQLKLQQESLDIPPHQAPLGHDLRKRVEALKSQGGSQWMKLYSEKFGKTDQEEVGLNQKREEGLETIDKEQVSVDVKTSDLKKEEEKLVVISKKKSKAKEVVDSKQKEVVDTKPKTAVDSKPETAVDSESKQIETARLKETSQSSQEINQDKIMKTSSKETRESKPAVITQTESKNHPSQNPLVPSSLITPETPIQVKPPVNLFSPVGPYRKLFEFPKDTLEKSVRVSPLMKSTSGFDVEKGQSHDFHGLDHLEKNVKLVPPLSIVNEAPKRNRPTAASHVSTRPTSTRSYAYSVPTLFLARPVASQRIKYTRSGTRSISSHGSNGYTFSISGFSPSSTQTSNPTSSFLQDLPLNPCIPFMEMTNALNLHLHFNIFESDREACLMWIPCSFVPHLPSVFTESKKGTLGVVQSVHAYRYPHQHELKRQDVTSKLRWMISTVSSRLDNVDHSLLSRQAIKNAREFTMDASMSFIPLDHVNQVVPLEKACYCLVSDRSFYLFTPTFSFPYSNHVTQYTQFVQEAMQQICYDDPMQYLQLYTTIPFHRMIRMDVGPHHQYITLFYALLDNQVCSVTVLTRDRDMTESLLESLQQASLVHTFPIHSNTIQAYQGFKEYVYLNPNRGKDTMVLQGYGVEPINDPWIARTLAKQSKHWWSSFMQSKSELESASESTTCQPSVSEDNHAYEQDEPPLLYVLGAWIIAPRLSTQPNPPIVRTVSCIGTRHYLYLIMERWDVYPHLVSQEDWSNTRLHTLCHRDAWEALASRGRVSDVVIPVSHVLKCIPIQDIVRLERWRSWRWSRDGSQQEAPTLESYLLQNGCIGVCRAHKKKDKHVVLPTGTASGWHWWIRLVMKTTRDQHAVFSHTGPPGSSSSASTSCTTLEEYHVDLLFTSIGNANDVIEYIQTLRGIRSEQPTPVVGMPVPPETSYTRLYNKDGVECVIGDD